MSRLVRPVALVVGLFFASVLISSADDAKKDTPAKDSTPVTKSPLPANWGKLGLNDDQKAKVTSIQGKYKGKIDDLKKQIAELQKEEKTALLDVLTDAQKARLKEISVEKAGGSGNKPEEKKP